MKNNNSTESLDKKIKRYIDIVVEKFHDEIVLLTEQSFFISKKFNNFKK